MTGAVNQMDIRLKPLSHPQLGEIVISDILFAVGRRERPFDSYPAEITAGLSRRHARLFVEQGAVYLVDLGSRNGTTISDHHVVGAPVKVQPGDVLRFGADLAYGVEIRNCGPDAVQRRDAARKPDIGAVVSATEAGLELMLTPQSGGSVLETLVIRSFPFLISKGTDTFARYKEHVPTEVNYLSRRHAHIYLHEGIPFIEDLGSTNGTFIDGQRLDERAMPLKDGQVIAFGGKYFVYQIAIRQLAQIQAHAQVPLTQAPPAGPQEGKTIFVASPTSFLDVFCQDAGEAEPQEDDRESAVKQHSRPPSPGLRGLPRRMGILIRDLRDALTDETGSRTRWPLWLGSALIVALGIGLTGLYLAGAPMRRLDASIAAGEWRQAAQIADQFLASHPTDAKLADKGMAAVLHAVTPAWITSVEAGDYGGAQALLTDARTWVTTNPKVQVALEALGWASAAEAFFAQRGGVDAPLVLFRDEQTLQTLVDRWRQEEERYRQALAQVERHIPEFAQAHARAFSRVRTLKTEAALHLDAIRALRTDLETLLQQDQSDKLGEVIRAFSEKYPKVAGGERLAQDLSRYVALQQAIAGRDLRAVLDKAGLTEFSTPVFQDAAQAALERALPPRTVIEAYQQATQDWRMGRLDEALHTLETLRTQPWGELAERELVRKHKVRTDLQSLQAIRVSQKDQREYAQRLLTWYAALNPEEDGYFLEQFEDEFKRHREPALEDARRAVQVAQGAWAKYREHGGISGQHRLEAVISGIYKDQARRLSEALEQASRGLSIYRLLDLEAPSAWTQQYDATLAELRLQRQALDDLNLVLEPTLLKAKLRLLAEPEPLPHRDPPPSNTQSAATW